MVMEGLSVRFGAFWIIFSRNEWQCAHTELCPHKSFVPPSPHLGFPDPIMNKKKLFSSVGKVLHLSNWEEELTYPERYLRSGALPIFFPSEIKMTMRTGCTLPVYRIRTSKPPLGVLRIWDQQKKIFTSVRKVIHLLGWREEYPASHKWIVCSTERTAMRC